MQLLGRETLSVAILTLNAFYILTILYSLHNPSESFLSGIAHVLIFCHVYVLVLFVLHFFRTPTLNNNSTEKLCAKAAILFLILHFSLHLTLISNFDGNVARAIRYLQTLHPTSTLVTTCQFLVTSYHFPEYPDVKYLLFWHVIVGIQVTVYRSIVPRVMSTEEYFDILRDKLEIAEYMNAIEGVSENGTYEENYGQRKQIALLTWYYGSMTEVGHVALGLTTIEENTQRQWYISIWPSSVVEQIGNDWRSGDGSKLESDVAQEHRYPDHILLFKKQLLHEEDILSEIRNSDWPPDYNVFQQNCMSAIKTVLIAGGFNEDIIFGKNFMTRLPATNTQEFADEIPFAFVLPHSAWYVQLLLYTLFSCMDICMNLELLFVYVAVSYMVLNFAILRGDYFRCLDRIIDYLRRNWNSLTENYPHPNRLRYYKMYFAFCFFASYFFPVDRLYKMIKDFILS